MMDCTCWVSRETPEAQFGIRWGAHNPACSLYKPSLDPVDKLNDLELRVVKETPTDA